MYICKSKKIEGVFPKDTLNSIHNYYSLAHEGGIAWNDPDLNIDWKVLAVNVVLSEKETKSASFSKFKSEF